MERIELPQWKLRRVFSVGSAAEQFRSVMEQHGIYVSPNPQRGAHDCRFYVSDKDKEQLRKWQGKRIVGATRDFVVHEYDAPFGNYKFWRVSYIKQEKQ